MESRDAQEKSSAAASPTPAASNAAASAAPPAPTPTKKPAQPQRAPSQPQPSLESTLDDVNRVMTWVATRLMQNCGMVLALGCAYRIRLHAVNNYGKVIHEFDPWFNYRATEYLLENGATKFFNWYDDKRYVTVFKKAVQKASQPPPTLLFFYFFPFPTASIFTQPTATYFTPTLHPSWYPLGRPIGTTIYPGLQFTSVFLYHVAQKLATLGPVLGAGVAGWFEGTTLNDVCVFVPAIFGVVTTLFTFLLTYEVARDATAGVVAAMIMAVTPSHLMRSVAGGYDNESIAVAAAVATFYFWVRSLRNARSWPWGLATAAAYMSWWRPGAGSPSC